LKFIITIDTEADDQWRRKKTVSVENLKYIPRFQELCDRYNFKPTYLCTYEIVDHSDFDGILNSYQKGGRAEIGSHLHPWTNPPYDNKYDTCDNIDKAAYPSELPLELFRNKLKKLTELIHLKTDKSPTSYRAGRWGFDASHIEVLLDLGYKVDSSVTPYVTWQNHKGNQQGGPDFRTTMNDPYMLNAMDVCKSGDSGLFEVPTTITSTNRLFDIKTLDRLFNKFRKLKTGRSISRKLSLDPKWFRPYPKINANELIRMYKTALRRNAPVIQMMFHSSELMPGGSPYNPTEESVELLFNKFEVLFSYIAKNGGHGITLTEYANEYNKQD